MRLLTVLFLVLISTWSFAAQSSLLEPVSASDTHPHTAVAGDVWMDDAGHVVGAYFGRPVTSTNLTPYRAYVAVKNGSSWNQVALPPMTGITTGPAARIQLVGKWGDLYCFVAFQGIKQLYYYTSSNGASWSGPKEAATFSGSAHPKTAAAGYFNSTPFFCAIELGAESVRGVWFYYKQGSSFTKIKVCDVASPNMSPTDLQVDERGRIYYAWTRITGQYRPLVAYAPSFETAKQSANWLVLPVAGATTSTKYWPAYLKDMKIDPARQCLWGLCRGSSGPLQLARLPFGALDNSSLRTWTLTVPEEGQITGADSHSLVANGKGDVGVLLSWFHKVGTYNDYLVTFYPTSPEGMGQPVTLQRGGSQTEANLFTSNWDSTCGRVDNQGVAHVMAVSIKKGEVPEGRERCFYSTVSGWSPNLHAPEQTAFGTTGGSADDQTATDDTTDDTTTSTDDTGSDTVTADTGGGGDTTPEGGAKPNFKVELAIATAITNSKDLNFVDNSIRLALYVTNTGAQYYGDLEVKAFVAGTTLKYVFRDESSHQQPLFTTGQRKYADLATVAFITTGEVPPQPQVVDCNVGGTRRVPLTPALGKYVLSVFVDPANVVDESDEENNKDFLNLTFYDGKNKDDQRPKTATEPFHYGLNDVRVMGAKVLTNCQFSQFGLRQKPTQLAVVIENPWGARWMKQVDVQSKLDGQLLGTQTIDLVPDVPSMSYSEIPWSNLGSPGEKIIRGAPVLFPLDLSSVALGQHTLEVVVDPENKLGDLLTSNNKLTVQFKVRAPGGTLNVKGLDSGSKAPIPGVDVRLEGLWYMKTNASGIATVEDFPAANYGEKTLSAEKLTSDKPYARKFAPPFSVRTLETTNITIELDGPVDIYGSITGPDGQKPTYGAVLGFSGECAKTSYNQQTGQYQITFAAPGSNTVSVNAYGYLAKSITENFLADAQGKQRLDIQLQEAPKGTIKGKVTGMSGSAMGGVVVTLDGSPFWTTTDAQGNYQLTGVMAGQGYGVTPYEKGYVPATNYVLPSLIANTTVTMDVVMHKVTQQLKALGADVLTWAICESYPGFELGSASSDGYEVSAYYGRFKPSLALTSHTEEGTNLVTLDNFVLGVVGHSFWESNVSSEWNPLDLVSSAVETATDTALGLIFGEDAGKVVAQLAELVDPLNSVVNLATGDIDPSQLHGEDEIIGTYTTHTGTKVEDTTLIELPSLEVPIGMSFAGGQTIVRVDRIEVTDGVKSKTINRQWYSDRECAYWIGDTFNIDNLEIICYMQVLNQDLSPGPLYANSKNRLIWKPFKNRWLRFEAFPYPFIP